LKTVNVREVREKFPERLVEKAVTRMLPKNKLGRQLATRLKVYAGPNHPHDAQTPKTIRIER
jgi:large subunit ribosomal protein L13